jgi:hypothetical protein
MEQRGPIGPDFDWLAPMMTQGCESDLGTRTGRFPTVGGGLTRGDLGRSSDTTTVEGTSCGAFCGARIRRRHGGAAWRLICGTLGATPTKTLDRKRILLRRAFGLAKSAPDVPPIFHKGGLV